MEWLEYIRYSEFKKMIWRFITDYPYLVVLVLFIISIFLTITYLPSHEQRCPASVHIDGITYEVWLPCPNLDTLKELGNTEL